MVLVTLLAAACGDSETVPLDAGPDADVGAPDTALASAPPAYSASATATFTLTSDDAAATFECSLDGLPFAGCDATVTTPALADGAHTFEARAVDDGGNVDPSPASHAWTVDTVAPGTTIDAGPPAVSTSAAAQLAFTSDDATATFECSLDGAAFAACTSPLDLTGLTDGAHAFAVRAVDLAGNADPSPAEHGWTVDATTPDTSITAGPPALSASASAQLVFTSDDAAATFQCSLDGVTFTVCASPVALVGLADGPHTFAVRAVDLAGNADPSPAEHGWTVDTTAPGTTITSGPAALSASATAQIVFTSDDAAATFECSLDSAAFAGCTSPLDLTGLADGAHAFAVRAVDAAGNADASPAEHGWTVDTTAPATTITSGPAALSASATAQLVFTSDDAAATFQCSLDGATFTVCASPVDLTGLADGAHGFAVFAVDAAGNADASPAQHAWTVDTTAPGTTITSGPPALSGEAIAQLAFASDDATATFRCSLDGAAFAACTSPVDLTGLADGAHTFAVLAVDAAGNADPSPAEHAWTVDTTAPETTITSGPPALAGEATAQLAFTSDDPAATFQCSLDGATFTVCASPVDLTGLADGPHTFAVFAVDAAGNADPSPAQHAWTVDTTAPVTSITAGPPALTASTSAQLVFEADDPAATFQCSLDGVTFTVCASPVDLVGLTDGPHTFAVFAVDAAGNADPTPAQHAWTVDTIPPDTTIAVGPPELSHDADAGFTFGGADSYECALDGGAWAPCPAAHVVTVAEGDHTLEVRGRDLAGNTDATPATHTWTYDVDECATGAATCSPDALCVDQIGGYACIGDETPLCFDGVDDRASTAGTAAFATLDAATIELWFRAATATGEHALVDVESEAAGDTRRVGVDLTDAAAAGFSSITGRALVVTVDAAALNARGFGIDADLPGFDETQWHHYAVVLSGTTTRLFVDGVEIVTAEQRAGTPDATFADAFGPDLVAVLQVGWSTTSFVAGLVEDLRISSTARYTTDFTPAYPLDADADAVVAYGFDDGAGTVATDGSASALDLALTGPAWGACGP